MCCPPLNSWLVGGKTHHYIQKSLWISKLVVIKMAILLNHQTPDTYNTYAQLRHQRMSH
jgi:hypothetical protein